MLSIHCARLERMPCTSRAGGPSPSCASTWSCGTGALTGPRSHAQCGADIRRRIAVPGQFDVGRPPGQPQHQLTDAAGDDDVVTPAIVRAFVWAMTPTAA